MESQIVPAAATEAPHFPPAPLLQSVAETAARLGPAFPEPTVRDLIYHAEPRLGANGETLPANGFGRCIVRVGRKVLLDWTAVLDFIESRRQSPREAAK